MEKRLVVEQDVSLNSNVEISNNLTVNNLLDVSGIIVNNQLNTDILEVSNIIITNKFTHNNIYSFRLNGTLPNISFNQYPNDSLIEITNYFNSHDNSFNYITNNVNIHTISQTESEFIIPYTGIYNINLLINWNVSLSLTQGGSYADYDFFISLGVKRGTHTNIDVASNTLYKMFLLDKPNLSGNWVSTTTQNINQTIYLEKDDKLAVYIKVTDHVDTIDRPVEIDFINSYFGATLINLMTKT
jgi:hypothetical protein